ncbi:hydantoinase B/oxoprolinase family protein [Pantoea osteomyelitidis]|uniref:Hydantoinase B/oxoprolinase family protein n=1 Tax=Pantoea osteomyelitidis TaxID=3230026 RepID=A0ABW7PZL8_9GAMM
MSFDPSGLQILANYCVAAAESMAHTLVRTAHSTFIKETEDFSCALLTPEGLAFASPKTLGATWYIGLDYGPVLGMIEDYRPGDVAMTNDAYSGNVATHSPDMVMWKPIFWQGKLVCFVGGHIHNTDVGGAVPASLSRTLTEIHQEGVRIPPTKIVREGVLDDALLNLLKINVRAPEQNTGDLHAQLAMLANGEKRVLEMVAHFGVDYFSQGMYALLDYAAMQAASVLETIPEGDYFFAEYADEDSVNGKPMRVAMTLKIRGGSAVLDYTGSDPQLLSSLNMPTGGMTRHALALVGYHYVLYTLNPDILLNAGLDRVVECVLPPGTVMNAVYPAAVGMRSLTCKLTHVLTFGAFSQAIPDRLPACAACGLAILNVKTTDPHGRTIIASIGPVGGGAGGMPFDDGEEGSGANVAFLRNTPVEINEAEVPIRINRYCLVPDSGGAGRYRGGLGLMMEFQVFAPNTIVTARNRDRTHFASWGVLGGKAGSNAIFSRNPDSSKAEILGNSDIIQCQAGDIIRLIGAGGGGYGSPLEREPERVLADVNSGYVSAAQAEKHYGVIIRNGEIDNPRTSALRASLSENEPSIQAHFDFGSWRIAFEKKWTHERYAALTEILASLPVNWRFFVKHQLFELLETRETQGQFADGKEGIHELFDDLKNRYPELQTF